MELVASLPPDLAAFADPTARAAAPPLRSTDQDDAAAAAAMPFELLLGLLTAPLPGGESLPATGNALPAGAIDAACDSTAPSSALAKPVTPSTLAGATGADLLARLKLAAAPAVNDQNSAPPPADAANAALPFADLDLPSTPDVAATKPAAVASTAPAAAAQVPAAPGPDVAAALEAALPQTAALDPAPKSPRAGQLRGADQTASRLSAAAVATDLRATQGSATTAPTPVVEVADAAARPVHRDATLDAFALPVTPSSGDAAAPPTGAAPAVAPTQSHLATAAAPAADASLLAGHGAAIDTRADNWHEALASRVQVLVDQNMGEAHIKLNPPELGAVDIKISLVDDKTFVQLTAGNSVARDELTQSLPRLRELLSASGLSLGGASVHGGSAGQSGHETAPRVVVPAYAPFAVADDDELGPVRITARPTGRIDLFA
jgi:flagellar hook-length control protein FliK